ncbi:DNA-binding protein [candidate division LCP-89 bacterium B3_LCP]|uniref:DNA-binding protein n=1 Tax=candidate division LCP-89 bacterium B3_LCP TaxID=2012998 RepID=A0A532V286_UNCL8|nr:MAG: DNA-binding protein [candidate division LCP-89 bacterium B3_LCP]
MNKSDLVREVASRTGLTQIEARAAVDKMVNIITNQVAAGKSVNLRGFGTFKAVTREARKAQHPRSRKLIDVPRKKVPVFRASPDWKDDLLKK